MDTTSKANDEILGNDKYPGEDQDDGKRDGLKSAPIARRSQKMDLLLAGLKNVNLAHIEQSLKAAGHNFDPKYKVMLDKPELDGGEYGVQETLDVLAVILTLVKAFIEGGIANYLAALAALPFAIIGLNKVPLELADLDEEDLNELIAYVIANFPTLPTDLAMAIVEHAIKALFHIYEIIAAVVANSEDPEQQIRGGKENPDYTKSTGLGTT